MNDAVYQTLDLRPFGLPPSATFVELELALYCGTAPDTQTLLAVRSPGHVIGGSFNLVLASGDGSIVLPCDSRAGIYAVRGVEIAVSPDGKIEFMRYNPGGGTRYWKIFMRGFGC